MCQRMPATTLGAEDHSAKRGRKSITKMSYQRHCKENHHDAEPLRPRTFRRSPPSRPGARGGTRAAAGTVVPAQTQHSTPAYTVQNILARLAHSPAAQIAAAHRLRKGNGYACSTHSYRRLAACRRFAHLIMHSMLHP